MTRRHQAHPATERNAGIVHPHEPRGVRLVRHSPHDRPHRELHEHPHEHAGPIPPAARDPAAAHKEPTRHAHDAFWRRSKSR